MKIFTRTKRGEKKVAISCDHVMNKRYKQANNAEPGRIGKGVISRTNKLKVFHEKICHEKMKIFSSERNYLKFKFPFI